MTSSTGTTNLTYDFESRVTQISGPGISASYSYNGLDTRVGKTENSVSNTFRRSGAYVTDPVLSDGTASYTPGVSRRTGTETRYFHTGLKNTDSLTNPGQTVAASRIYDAFGNVTSSSGTWSGPFGYAGNFGYQADASGLKLLGHRYYDPSTGRFLTRDPIKDGRNWYSYGAGETAPTIIVDPWGLSYVFIPGDAEFAAGWGDTIAGPPGFLPAALGYGSANDMVRGWLGAPVNKGSDAYRGGQMAGTVHGLVMGGKGVAKGAASAAGARMVRPPYPNPGNTRILGRGMDKKVVPHATKNEAMTIRDDMDVPYSVKGWLMNLQWIVSSILKGRHFDDLGGSLRSWYYAMERAVIWWFLE